MAPIWAQVTFTHDGECHVDRRSLCASGHFAVRGNLEPSFGADDAYGDDLGDDLGEDDVGDDLVGVTVHYTPTTIAPPLSVALPPPGVSHGRPHTPCQPPAPRRRVAQLRHLRRSLRPPARHCRPHLSPLDHRGPRASTHLHGSAPPYTIPAIARTTCPWDRWPSRNLRRVAIPKMGRAGWQVNKPRRQFPSS
jgi:hypothetical protein